MKKDIPFIKFDADYFRTTVRQESRYHLAWRWVKETLQNAVDAKAKEIVYVFDQRDRTFEVTDDGIGMTEDIILNKFLAIGGTKKSGTHVGGFGDAKKVVCFCWDSWTLESNKSFLSSEMLGVEPIRKSKTSRQGTRIRAVMDDCFDVEQAVSYIRLCEVRNVKIKAYEVDMDGNRSEIKLSKFAIGKPLESLDFGELYLAKSTDRNAERLSACVVRVNGLAMFYYKISGLKRDMVFELKNLADPKDPEYVMNVQRDGLKWQADYKLTTLLDEYRSEPHKMFAERSNNDNIVSIHRGIGDCESMRHMMFDKPVFSGLSLSDGGDSTVDAGVPLVGIPQEAMADNQPEKVTSAFADIYPYDFIIKGKTTKQYTGIKYKRFCLMWHKMIQYILFWNLDIKHEIDVGSYKIGFVFPSDESVKAQYVELQDGTPCFLLNPDISIGDNSWRCVVLEIMDRAIHEITHRFHPLHDGNFMELYNRIKSICYHNIEDFFSLGYDILKANQKQLFEKAKMDETYEQYD